MKSFLFEPTSLCGVYKITPFIHTDNRGFFVEMYQAYDFEAEGIRTSFVQTNESYSTKGVLRGLHFQKEHTQAKLVHTIYGNIYDVVLDCRPNSPTFGKWEGFCLDAEKRELLYIPEGMAHGFLVLSDIVLFSYQCSDIYDPTSEGGVSFNDPDLRIEWPELDVPYSTSEKDKRLKQFKEQNYDCFLKY